jgi:hypothetical protein
MRAISGGRHSPDLQTKEEKKRKNKKTCTAAAGRALCAIINHKIHNHEKLF